ncbi:hypothetical protein BH10ACT3_BH10ACT3_05220 [soil metagenome]
MRAVGGTPLTSPVVQRLRIILLLVVAALAFTACKVQTNVAIKVDEGGSGTVTVTVVLDADASQRLGDPATAVRLDDVRAAGWNVSDPASGDGGSLTFTAIRAFASPDELALVLGEIGGGDGGADSTGVFRDVLLTVTDGFASTDYSFSTHVELSGSLDQFSDPELAAALGGLPLARSPEELAADGATAPGAFDLQVGVNLPGTTSDSNGTLAGPGGSSGWRFPLADGTATSTTISSSSTVSDQGPVRLLIGGAIFVVLALVLVVVGLLRRSR